MAAVLLWGALVVLLGVVQADPSVIEKFVQEYTLPRACTSLPKFTDVSSNLQYLEELFPANLRPSTRALEEYMLILLPYMECTPPPAKVLKRPKNLTYDCSGPNWMGPRPKPKLLYDIFPFAHELDILDMRLYELDEVVDRFVLFENLYTHRVWKRPLFFERNKYRYQPFLDKIYHLIADDSAMGNMYDKNAPQKDGEDWRGETIMRELPWKAFKSIVGSEAGMSDIIFFHSDADEIPNAETLMHYKHCIPAPPIELPVVLTATFYRHNFDWAIWDDEKPVLFEGRHMAQQFNHVLPRFSGGRIQNKHNDPAQRSYTVNRMTNAYGDIFKDLALAEGGYVPRGKDLGRKILLDPLLTNEWRSRGIRNCCEGDTNHLKPRRPDQPIPWFAWYNKHRFAEYFPKECAEHPEECKP